MIKKAFSKFWAGTCRSKIVSGSPNGCRADMHACAEFRDQGMPRKESIKGVARVPSQTIILDQQSNSGDCYACFTQITMRDLTAVVKLFQRTSTTHTSCVGCIISESTLVHNISKCHLRAFASLCVSDLKCSGGMEREQLTNHICGLDVLLNLRDLFLKVGERNFGILDDQVDLEHHDS
jgi:hypothetical protein